MKAVLGIGNPGLKYQNTKHNIGFIILDKITEDLNLRFQPSKGDYYLARGTQSTSCFVLAKPTTYVNNSGIAATHLLETENIDYSDLLVVVDDLNLEAGSVRFRQRGGDGGHNGLSSIIYHLNSNEFPRIRIGIGNDFESGNMASYVLSGFNNEDQIKINKAIEFSKELILKFILGGTKELLDYISKTSYDDLTDQDKSDERE